MTKKIMKIRLLVVILIVLITGWLFVNRARNTNMPADGKISTEQSNNKERKIKYWTCAMHPDVKQDGPGNCPICNMDLIPVYEEEAVDSPVQDKKEKKLLFYRNPMNGSITSPVPMKDDMGMDYIPVYEEEEMSMDTESAGQPATVRLKSNEITRAQVDSVQVKVRRLFKDIRTVGRIAYDPDLVVAQQEYLTSLETVNKLENSPEPEAVKRAGSMVERAKYRLTLLGMSAEQIMEIERSGTVQNNLVIAGHSVWVYADVYQEDAPLIKVGEKIDVFTEAVPNKIFPGTIKAIDPVLNEMTRSVKIRAEIANHEFELKPGMYVNAVINIILGEKLAVPKEAVLDTGLRKVVWIDKGAGKYERRDIEIGAEVNAVGGERLQKYYLVLKGLRNSEKVVSRANFLIDSQSIISGTGVSSAYSGAIAGETNKEKQTTESMSTGHKH
jgi:membrane fusion protein, copper/silver efflux system